MGKPKGKIVVCKVEYETKDRTNWKAVILAYDMKEAIDYLIRNVKDFDRYISTQIIGDVDAITKTIYDDYFVNNETRVVETVIQAPQEVVQSDEDRQPACPWCDKEFKSKLTLGTHIKKYHMGD